MYFIEQQITNRDLIRVSVFLKDNLSFGWNILFSMFQIRNNFAYIIWS